MTLFRPCIDIHDGRVKQIVGGTLGSSSEALRENFVSDRPASWFAELYQREGLRGGHVIKLGPGEANEESALEALRAYPGGLQLGGGVNPDNAGDYLDAGASHVIVTSWLFSPEGRYLPERLEAMRRAVGASRLVVDLSCRAVTGGWTVAMNRWQTLTDLHIDPESLDRFSDSCAELLVHAADVEGRCEGIDRDLVVMLGAWGGLPVTYAGGASRLGDLELVEELSGGAVDLTIGSALDLFGGSGVRYADCVAWNKRSQAS